MIGLIKGLHATISHLLTPKVTIQYPEVRRRLPERSRGLIRMRLKPDGTSPRCIACTFCEQVCPSVAIRVVYDQEQPGKVWSLDAGAGPMLSLLNEGESAVEMEPWPLNGEAGANGGPAVRSSLETDGCLAAAFITAEELTARVLSATARKNGIWLSQAFGVATFYDQLGPGKPAPGAEAPLPEVHGAVDGCTPVITGSFGSIDPESIDAYSGAGGYRAVTKILTGMTPAEVVEEIALSGLRGRSGSGFPVSKKWNTAAATEAPRKYVICNGGEGDPGSFKDRAILELSPHAVIEGMIITGYATGAGAGYICLNAANKTAVARVTRAVEQARERGLLGEEIPGTDFTFDVSVKVLPEAYIGGEETALISTLEGKRPQSRVRPPYPAEQGLFGMPTLVENVETLATITWIMRKGAREFLKIGAANAPGTKLFTVHGAVNRPGIYEAPLSTSLKKLVEEGAGGFISEPRAALVGSVGGGFLTPGIFDIPLDFDSLRETGGDLSSGTVEIMAAGDSVVGKVRECLAFSSSQSCGKCVPGRLGTRRLLDIIERLDTGAGRTGDVELAEQLAHDIADGSLCSLGRGAVRPLLTALRFFREDFQKGIAADIGAQAGGSGAGGGA